MSDPYLSQISMYGFGFTPKNHAACDGALVPIKSSPALYSLLGSTYGGDGRTTFAYPDLSGRVPISQGTETYQKQSFALGQAGGTETVTLTESQLAEHTHQLYAGETTATNLGASPDRVLANTEFIKLYSKAGSLVQLSSESVGSTGGGKSHTNLQPTLVVNFVICIDGSYPRKN